MRRAGMWVDVVIILVVCALAMGLLARRFFSAPTVIPSETPSKQPAATASPVSTPGPSNQPIQKTPARIDDIREAVFRWQFENNASYHREKVIFLSIDDKDPGDAFMKRFKGYRLPVKKMSQSKRLKSEKSLSGVVDKNTGARGIIFRIKSITWITNNEVEVEGGYYEHGLSASVNVYHVVYRDHHWVVDKDTLLLISESAGRVLSWGGIRNVPFSPDEPMRRVT